MQPLFASDAVDKVIFQPHPASYQTSLTGLSEVRAADGTTLALIHLPNNNAQQTVFYFHGNAEDLGDCLPVLKQLQSAGFAVLAFDYRGYGRSTGQPEEGNVYADTKVVLAHAKVNFGVTSERLLVVGRSLGGGPAVELAMREPVAGLILVSAFQSVARMAPGVKLAPDRFDNLTKIVHVRAPILIIHGTADEVVPFAQGQALFAAASEPKRAVWLEGVKHNNVFATASDRFLSELKNFAKNFPPGKEAPLRACFAGHEDSQANPLAHRTFRRFALRGSGGVWLDWLGADDLSATVGVI